MGLTHATIDTSLGRMLSVATDTALTGLYFSDHKHPPTAEQLGEAVNSEAHPIHTQAARELREYLSGERRTFSVPLDLHGDGSRGDDFSRRVWELLLEIPFGETTTYGALATRLGNVAYAQRVGQSVGHNPIMVLVPCHRVLGAGGSLTGYAGGLDRKRTLLALEEPPAELSGRLF